MIRIEKKILNMFGENTYLIWDDITKDTVLFDPGCSDNDEEKHLDDFISKNDLKIRYLINTHCHIDHILGNSFVKSKYNPEFLAAEEDVFLLDLMLVQAESFGLKMKKSPFPDRFLKEGESVFLSDSEIIPLFTPGHSPGGYCFYFKNEGFCITGDVLFREGLGRTDLWGGDYDALIDSIETKLFTLPGDVKIYPGHGESSTIEYEKNNNPFLK